MDNFMPGGSLSCVVAGTGADGDAVVLKLLAPWAGTAHRIAHRDGEWSRARTPPAGRSESAARWERRRAALGQGMAPQSGLTQLSSSGQPPTVMPLAIRVMLVPSGFIT
jgi:hypothetical protein